jgi:membrane associated rhomboid family serine protease
MNRLTPVVEKILIGNLIIFAIHKFFGFDLVDLLGLRYIFSLQFTPYQLITHLFMHASLGHLFSNMFTLITFGPILEMHLSSRRFLALYLVTGIGAALLYTGILYLEIDKFKHLYLHYFTHPTPEGFSFYLQKFPKMYSNYYPFVDDFFQHSDDPAYIAKSKAIVAQLYRLKTDIPIVGASGAIFGLLTAFAMLYPHARLSLFLLPIPIQAKYFVILYGMYELYAGLQNNPSDNVAHFAHLGGILFAYLVIKWYQRRAASS